ncbi:26s proteasome regulatory subunit n6 [Trichoderma arundinaceum]|uniref:26s proteasome regulatory subunit n6 n=1 Tax=Trichoderma arundinaceum TaxID=490622 RepID=A0A395NX36_TRIAR|nr:26s proteasome regulatory subunit n6 [Trichoderma arundinaceum]
MQQQYRAYAQQAPQRSPHPPNQRRGGIGPMMSSGPHPSVPLTQAQIAQQQQAQAHASELAKRRSRKPTDKNIPDGVEDCIVDPDGVKRYVELRDIERLIDATITRKRLDVLDDARRSSKLRKTLRIWISNTAEDQIWQGNSLNADSFDFTPAMEAFYRVKIEGYLLDEDDDVADLTKNDLTGHTASTISPVDKHEESSSVQKAAGTETNQKKHRFSHFFQSISVDFDRSRFRNGSEQSVEWRRPEGSQNQAGSIMAAEADFDEFTFKRNGDENMNITINLQRHESPERYQLTPELAQVVDMNEATQHEAVMALWEYIRLSGLQEDEERRNFRCDNYLKKVIGRDSGVIPMLSEYVMPHLRPLPPICLPYTIRVDEEFHRSPQPTVYDVQVLVEDPIRANLRPLLNNPQYAATLKQITMLDEQLARLVQAISMSKAKHSFFSSLSEDPANFVKSWLSSQKRDLEIIMGEAASDAENVAGDEWRRGGNSSVWNSQNARESVNVLLSRQR